MMNIYCESLELVDIYVFKAKTILLNMDIIAPEKNIILEA
jgi:hypothetical protein